MDYRSYRMSRKEYVRYGLEAALLTGIAAFCFYDSFWAFIGFPVILYGYWKEKQKELARKRRKALKLEFRDAVQGIAAALAAGYSAENALGEARKDLQLLNSEKMNMVQELAAMQRKLDANQTLEGAMLDFAERSGLEEAEIFAEIFAAGKRNGGDLIEIINDTARTISETVETERQIQTIFAAQKYEQKLMTGIPFVMILYLRIGCPGFLNVLYHNAAGIIVATVCLCIFLGAWYLGRRLLEIEV